MNTHHALLALLLLAPASVVAGEASIKNVDNPLMPHTLERLIDSNGKVVVVGGHLTALKGGGFLAKGNQGSYLYSAQGQRVGGPFGYIEEVDPALDALVFTEGEHPVLGGKGGLITRDGKVLVSPTYRKLEYLGHGLFRFEKARRFGVIDQYGAALLAPEFDAIDLSGNILLVHDKGRSAIFGLDGHPIRDFAANTLYRQVEETGYTQECTSDLTLETCILLDPHGQPAFGGTFLSVDFDEAMQRWIFTVPGPPSSDRAVVYTLYTPAGKLLKTIDANGVSAIGGRLVVSINSHGEAGYQRFNGLMDADGNWLVRPDKYQDIRMLSVAFEDSAAGKQAPAQFAVTQENSDGKDLAGVIDAQGREILPPRYEQVLSRYPSLGIYMVKQDDLRGVVDNKGAWRIRPRFEREANNSTLPLPYQMFVRSISDDNRNHSDVFELYNLETGKSVIQCGPYEYLSVQYDHDWKAIGLPWIDFAIVTAKRNGKYGAIDMDGKVLLDFIYDNLEALSDTGRLRATQGEQTTMVASFDADRQNKFDAMLADFIRKLPAQTPSKLWPFMGRYIPQHYVDAQQVRADAHGGTLSSAVAPILVVGPNENAITHLNMVVGERRPHFRVRADYCSNGDAFWIPIPEMYRNESCSNDKPDGLVFRAQADGSLQCTTCAAHDLPETWVKVPTDIQSTQP